VGKGKRLRESKRRGARAPSIAAVMIVKNEEKNLPRSLKSIEGVVDEIVIVDTGSTDSTIEIALNHGAKLVQYEWDDDFSKPRNLGIEAATKDWILHLDADEELRADRARLTQLASDPRPLAYNVHVVTADNDEDAKTGASIVSPRLFRRRSDIRYEYPIHEMIKVGDLSKVVPADFRIYHFGPIAGGHRPKHERNIPILIKALEVDPENAYLNFMLGTEYWSSSKGEEALHRFDQALKFADLLWMKASAERNRAMMLFALGREKEAAESLKQSIGRYPDFTDLYYIYGTVALAVGDKQAASEHFKSCIVRGDAPPIYQSLGGTGSWRAKQGLEQL